MKIPVIPFGKRFRFHDKKSQFLCASPDRCMGDIWIDIDQLFGLRFEDCCNCAYFEWNNLENDNIDVTMNYCYKNKTDWEEYKKEKHNDIT